MENPKINLEKKMQGNAESQSSPRIPIEIRPTSGNKLLHEMQRKQAPQEKSPKFAMENPKINLEKKMQGNAERQSSPRIPIEIQPTSFLPQKNPREKKTFLSEVPGNAEKTSSPQTPY